LDGETCDQHHRNKTVRKQPAAIILLKKKNFSMTSPNTIVIPQNGASRDIADL
jgi:hypothetical protein